MFVCRKKRFVDLSADDVLNSLSNFNYFEIEFIKELFPAIINNRKIHYRNKNTRTNGQIIQKEIIEFSILTKTRVEKLLP